MKVLCVWLSGVTTNTLPFLIETDKETSPSVFVPPQMFHPLSQLPDFEHAAPSARDVLFALQVPPSSAHLPTLCYCIRWDFFHITLGVSSLRHPCVCACVHVHLTQQQTLLPLYLWGSPLLLRVRSGRRWQWRWPCSGSRGARRGDKRRLCGQHTRFFDPHQILCESARAFSQFLFCSNSPHWFLSLGAKNPGDPMS